MRPLLTMRPQPRIQCSTGPFWAFELEEALDVLADAGFQQIELMITRDPQTHDPDVPLQLARDRGLEIASVHGPFLVITKTVWGLDPIQKIERGADFCRAVGADTYVVHPPHLWEREYARWVMQDCAEFSVRRGVSVAVETMYPWWIAGRRVRGHRWLDPRELLSHAPIVALDTSHLAVGRRDILDAYKVLQPKLVHIHLSDNAGNGKDGHLEPGRGILPLGRFLAEVNRSGYAGTVSLELGVRSYVGRAVDLVTMLRRNREYLERELNADTKLAKGLPRG